MASASQAKIEFDKLDAKDSNVYISGGNQTNITNVYDGSVIQNEDENVYRWLSAIIPSEHYNGVLTKRLERTGLWFIGGPRFIQWKSEAGSFLWVHGKSGSGKTVLSASIIQDILYLCQPNPTVACAYFFFDGRDSQKELQLHGNLIRSLIRQFSAKFSAVPDALKALYSHCHGGDSQPSIDTLQKTLMAILNSFEHAYIIIDSLDECTERKMVLKWIEDISGGNSPKLHLLATSRDEEDIARRLRLLDPDNVFMKPEYVNADIERYVEHMLQTDEELGQWNGDLRMSIKSGLMKSADGMFRLVSLQLVALQDCYSQALLEERMRCLPNGLDDFYDRIVAKIHPNHREDALKFLQWLAFSARPLKLSEIVQVAGVVPDPEYGLRFKSSHVYRDPRLVLQACSSLVTHGDGTVKLAHMSVKDYLLSKSGQGPQDDPTAFNISERLSHSLIGQMCLAYLLQFNTLDMVNPNTLQNFPLADYAAQYWTFHIRSGSDEWSNTQLKLIGAMFRLRPGPEFITWVRLNDIDGRNVRNLDRSPHSIPSPLYCASMAGVLHGLTPLLKKGVDVDAWRGKHGNALQAASLNGHEMVVRLLLDKGANVNAGGGYHGSALQASVHNGHGEIVVLLLDKGANVNARGGKYENALQTAILKGHEEIAMFLLARGAHADGNALQTASLTCHESIVRLLLNMGADINMQGGPNGSALQAASVAGHEAIVRLLLEQGARVNAQGGYYGNALQAASYAGFQEIVNLLLYGGADVNAQGGYFGTALQAASYRGHEVIVKLLLNRGADPDAQGGHHGNALQAASSIGHKEIVKLLLERGANPNAQGGYRGNALQAALSKGHETIVKLLTGRY